MRFCLGTTRFVILHKKKAYKIGRVRPVKFVLKLCGLMISPYTQSEKLYRKYHRRFFPALVKYLFVGYYANQSEYLYFQERQSPDFAPILQKILWGWIIVQPQCSRVSAEAVAKAVPYLYGGERELCSPRQFGRNEKGRIVVLDYAHFKFVSLPLYI